MKQFWTPGLGRYMLRHPSAVPVLARAAWRLRRDAWWRCAPFLPLPGDAYWKFRITTVAGTTGELDPRGVVDAARWSLRQRVGA